MSEAEPPTVPTVSDRVTAIRTTMKAAYVRAGIEKLGYSATGLATALLIALPPEGRETVMRQFAAWLKKRDGSRLTWKVEK